MFRCNDCNSLPDNYMVKNELWESLGLSYRDNLCLSCLTSRLGRRLREDDLMRHPTGETWPINRPLLYRLD